MVPKSYDGKKCYNQWVSWGKPRCNCEGAVLKAI